jgi:hypothetical protein
LSICPWSKSNELLLISSLIGILKTMVKIITCYWIWLLLSWYT